MIKGPTHYKGHGRNGLNFACYDDVVIFKHKYPKASSSIDKVTCDRCWLEILKLTINRTNYNWDAATLGRVLQEVSYDKIKAKIQLETIDEDTLFEAILRIRKAIHRLKKEEE